MCAEYLQANVILGLEPGEVFTQRNVGNQVGMMQGSVMIPAIIKMKMLLRFPIPCLSALALEP